MIEDEMIQRAVDNVYQEVAYGQEVNSHYFEHLS